MVAQNNLKSQATKQRWTTFTPECCLYAVIRLPVAPCAIYRHRLFLANPIVNPPQNHNFGGISTIPKIYHGIGLPTFIQNLPSWLSMIYPGNPADGHCPLAAQVTSAFFSKTGRPLAIRSDERSCWFKSSVMRSSWVVASFERETMVSCSISNVVNHPIYGFYGLHHP